MRDLHLVIFDVDGTLVDSQADILRAMQAGFSAVDRAAPERRDILSIVGLSLDHAIATLAPTAGPKEQAAIVAAYKAAYLAHRKMGATSPLYPGIAKMLARLSTVDHLLLGIATGKSRRGLTALLQSHDLQGVFVTEQVADFHPSKPHPAMLQAALDETGVPADRALMVGDTSFDMDMAQAAGIYGLGVSWGYHDRARLHHARRIIDDIAELDDVIQQLWGITQ